MSRQQQARANNPTKEIVSLGKAHDFAEQFPKVPLPLGLSKSLYEMLADFVFFTPALANLHGAFVDGHFVGIEVKSATGKPTELQKICGRQIEEAGGTWLVVSNDVALEVLDAVIENRKDR